jgi:chromatin assembly factor 1 subunit A
LDQVLTSLSKLPSTSAEKISQTASDLKTASQYSVRAILEEIAEAEVSGDASAVRSLLELLQNRALIPAKALIFADDSRPGYLGTWTRGSSVVGPRTPFARDTVALDYSYDSGEEWEEEPGDADDVVEDDNDDDQDEGKDSDADSWLVDDDEVEPEVSPDDMELLSLSPVPAKRKATVSELSKPLKKRKVVPLVPFIKGPCWEPSIGETLDILNSYRIRLFNGE